MSNTIASHRVWSLLLDGAIDDTDELFSQGNLKNFKGSTSTIEGVNRSIHVTTGRFSNTALQAVSCQKKIPIFSIHIG